MNVCDLCGGPCCSLRCPICVRNHGDAPNVNRQLSRVEPPTGSQRHADRVYGWESEAT